ncbi:porin [Methylobacterium indicum]|uniref:porin n=1 Tax=Methylobacterium indicum TaxID=1775910 RepID=UPI002435AEF4|nr:porin [Methylobacterium indicum]
MAMRFTLSSLTVALLSTGSALAADLAAPAPAPVAVVEHCKATLSLPAYGGVIKPNPNPSCFALGGFGDIYVGGAITGYAYTQTNPFPFSAAPLPSDRAARVDFTNIQGWIQKADGPFQFYVQAGAYAIPALGFLNYSALDQTDLLFSPLPVAFGKYVFNDNWSIQGGRMPTLIGTEAPFTFQNLNISRGLLFNQENIINHGVQVNYSDGPWSASVAGTDGFFSGNISWLTGAITYKLDDNNTFGINGGLNLDRTDVLSRSLRYSYATPLFQQNSGILSINYTYSNGPWTITPYFQYTNVARDFKIGIAEGASTYGGAVLASYAFNDNFALAGRVEYIAQTGDRFAGGTSLLYGAGSSALSFTITPTFTFDRYFVRGEYSRVQLYDISRGDLAFGTLGTGFGRTGNRTSQDRYMIEGGITF